MPPAFRSPGSGLACRCSGWGDTAIATSEDRVFISHASRDAATAREMVAALEGRGTACWISSRDVAPGANYQEAIVAAIGAASAMVLLLTEAANGSDEVKKELALASSQGVPVYPVRFGDVAPNAALRYELATRQWIEGDNATVAAERLSVALSAPALPPALPAATPLALPDKPSLVVLPFQNMSGDPEQEYFADGLVEDITTALSCIRSLFVIARNSAFAYKGKSPDIRQVGRELGVRYVLEGSVRKSGNRVRITGQLVDATTGAHLWANRFDGALDDVFDLQDQVTASVAGAIQPHLRAAEIERAQRKPTQDLGAYDYYLRGIDILHADDIERTAEAQALFAKAYALDPKFAAAYALAARCIANLKNANRLPLDSPDVDEALRLVRLAVTLGADDAEALSYAGSVTSYVGQDPEAGALLHERACALNPNLARAWNALGYTRIFLGDPATAIDCYERALRLSPLDPARAECMGGLAWALSLTSRHDEAVAWAERAFSERTSPAILNFRVVAYAQAGRMDDARRAVQDIIRLNPSYRLSTIATSAAPLRRPEDMAAWIDAFRRAGLPE